MNFNEHLNLKGSHAVFGASKSSWLRYTQDKMRETISSQYRVTLGTEIHEFAAFQIKLNHKVSNIKNLKEGIENYIYYKYYNQEYNDLSEYGKKIIFHISDIPKETFETIKAYINDGIGYRMTPEQVLYFSDLFFGTTDAICFRNNYLRIHDLKTGSHQANIEQLLIYEALFCLEYAIQPSEIESELRIYQNNTILYHNPQVDEIVPIMDKIISDNKYLQKFNYKEP